MRARMHMRMHISKQMHVGAHLGLVQGEPCAACCLHTGPDTHEVAPWEDVCADEVRRVLVRLVSVDTHAHMWFHPYNL